MRAGACHICKKGSRHNIVDADNNLTMPTVAAERQLNRNGVEGYTPSTPFLYCFSLKPARQMRPLFPLDCRCCPLRLNASMWCHAVRSRFVSFESFANQDVIRSRRGWLSDSSHWISPTCANAQLRFTTPRFARGNSGGWLDAIESTEKPDCLVAALGHSVDSRRTSNYSPWSL